jgi:hypothetical protein
MTRNMMLVASITVLMAATSASGCREGPAEPGARACIDSTELVDVRLIAGERTLALRAPANFFGRSNEWKGGDQRSLTLNVEYPSMRAMPRGTLYRTCRTDALRKAADPSEWSADRLEITLAHPAIRFPSPSDHLQEVQSDVPSLIQKSSACMIATPFRSIPRGGAAGTCAYVFWYFPPAPTPDGPRAFDCTGVVENTSASCVGHFTYRGIPVDYTFKRARLGEWQSIHVRVKILIDSFAAAATSP